MNFEFFENLREGVANIHEILSKGFTMDVEDKDFPFVFQTLTETSFDTLVSRHNDLIEQLAKTDSEIVRDEELLYYHRGFDKDALALDIQLVATKDCVDAENVIQLRGYMEYFDPDGERDFTHWDCFIPIDNYGTSREIKFTVEDGFSLPSFLLNRVLSCIFFIMSHNGNNVSFLYYLI